MLNTQLIPENEIPQEVKKVIDEKKGSEFKLAYTDPEYTYILIGYGKQVIRVTQLF